MKRFLLLTSFLLTFFNCSNELEFKEQAFQGVKDNVLWEASDFSAQIREDGSLRIVGTLRDEVLILNLSGTDINTYELGVNASNSATYTTFNSPVFSTENRGNGEISIENFDTVAQTVSGTFRLNAFSADGNVTNIINGVFFRVPIVMETEAPVSELKASVDETELVAEEVVSTKQNGLIEIQGNAADGRFIKIVLPENITEGSFNLNEQSASGTFAVYGFANGETSTAQFGTLFINEHNITSNNIKGTFVFTTLLPNSVSVDSGNFTVFY